jgi:hypothetical protein
MFHMGKRHGMCPLCLHKYQIYKSIQYQQMHSSTIMYFTPN